MAFDLSKLHVVCMRCPAVATLLLVEMEAYRDSILIWCECHGEHVLGSVRGETITKARKLTPVAEPVRISMQSMERIEREEAMTLRADTHAQLSMASKRIEALDHFLGAPKSEPEPDPEPRYTHDCELCEFLGRYGEHDLYLCPAPIPALISRASSEPADYEALTVFGDTRTLDPRRYAVGHPLSEALRRVLDREAA